MFKKIFSKLRGTKLRGISIGGVGASWETPKDDKEIVRSVIHFLEDRRVLYRPEHLEVENHVIQSVIQIRQKLTEAISKLPENSRAIPHLKAMRAACREFLDNPPVFPNFPQPRRGLFHLGGFLVGLGELRRTFGIELKALCALFKIEVEDDLKQIFPPKE